MSQENPVNILLVEDNPGDVELILEALEEHEKEGRIHVVEDGEDALAFLYKKDNYKDAPTPDLVLLDLNLPKKSGQEVLADIKGNPELRNIPVVIFTSSEADRDMTKSYGLHANAYIVKPVELEGFLSVVKEVERFWIHVVKRPKND